MTSPYNGFLVVDKPSGMTSHDVVARARRGSGIKKIGHAGTLDPMATGVLILCLGFATRLSEYVMAGTKTYEATLRLGLETDTYDADGRVTAEFDAGHITRVQFDSVLPAFTGSILQVPPMYSAIQKNGQRLYELARAGKAIEREPRPVTISAITVIGWKPPLAAIEVTCSAGTYIRSLAHDIGTALGVGAHLGGLRRTRSGQAGMGDLSMIDWQSLLKAFQDGTWPRSLVDEQDMLGHLPLVTLDAVQAGLFQRGQSVVAPDMPALAPGTQDAVRVYDPSERIIGIAEIREDRLQPSKVFL